MKLEDLKVNSFVTSLNNTEAKTVKGQFAPNTMHTGKDDCSYPTIKYNNCYNGDETDNICITGQPCPYDSNAACVTLPIHCVG